MIPVQGACRPALGQQDGQQCRQQMNSEHDLDRGVLGSDEAQIGPIDPCSAVPGTPPPRGPGPAGGARGVHSLSPTAVPENLASGDSGSVVKADTLRCRLGIHAWPRWSEPFPCQVVQFTPWKPEGVPTDRIEQQRYCERCNALQRRWALV
jgi:hypothetical protein